MTEVQLPISNHTPVISRHGDPTPMYFKLQMILKREIEGRKWRPGRAIPTERTLAQIYQVSLGTVKRALLNLANEGYVNRIQGRGTFVLGSALRSESLRYYRLLRSFKDKEAELRVKLLNINKVSCSTPVDRYLGIHQGQKLYKIKRLFLHGEKPVVYTVSYLPQKLFPDLDKWSTSRFEKTSLYLALEQHYHFPTILNHELFGTLLADGEAAQALHVKVGSEVLYIEMTSFTYRQKPYEYRETYCLTHEYKVFRETHRRFKPAGGARPM
jgi:GntR family transcriptional regulator